MCESSLNSIKIENAKLFERSAKDELKSHKEIELCCVLCIFPGRCSCFAIKTIRINATIVAIVILRIHLTVEFIEKATKNTRKDGCT